MQDKKVFSDLLSEHTEMFEGGALRFSDHFFLDLPLLAYSAPATIYRSIDLDLIRLSANLVSFREDY